MESQFQFGDFWRSRRHHVWRPIRRATPLVVCPIINASSAVTRTAPNETVSPKGTSAVVRSYIDWIGPSRSHRAHFAAAVRASGNDPHTIFDALYRNMRVLRFGRLAKFDYLSLIGRLGIAPIEAGSAYLDEATGPAKGGRLLFDGRADGPSDYLSLQSGFSEIASTLGVSMQVTEDAICNWQKSPTKFVHFKG